jgi:hypothetical protein
MKKELTRKQMISLISSDFGFGEETTKKIKTEILKEVCNSSQPHIYLSALLASDCSDIYLEE